MAELTARHFSLDATQTLSRLTRSIIAILIALSIACSGHFAEADAGRYDADVSSAAVPHHNDNGRDDHSGQFEKHSCHGTCHLLSGVLAKPQFDQDMTQGSFPDLQVAFRDDRIDQSLRPPIDLLSQPLFG